MKFLKMSIIPYYLMILAFRPLFKMLHIKLLNLTKLKLKQK